MEIMVNAMVNMNFKLLKASVGINKSYPSIFGDRKIIILKIYGNQYS
jgi:hypothetical protein